VTFHQLFPFSAWLWRRLISHWARRIYFCCVAIIIVPALALRVQAFLFERRAVEIASHLSTLRIGITSKSEAISRIPSLAVVSSKDHDYDCSGDECFSVEIPNTKFSIWALMRVGDHATLASLLHWWGVRYWTFNAYVNFTSGTVSGFSYRLKLSLPSAYPVPGVLSLGASSRRKLDGRQLDWQVDESPDYEVLHYFKWPDLQTHVYFTRESPVELLPHAFNLHLRCLWSLRGCQTANQVLPDAEQDRLRITRSALERMSGPYQCPNRVLLRRARDTEDILLVEVTNVSPTVSESEVGPYLLASFRLLRALKGKTGRPLNNVWVNTEIQMPEITAHNSAIDLLKPGQRILLFSGASTNIDEPCEAMAGTEDAVNTVEDGLRALEPSANGTEMFGR
jgi:hypothetical protein